MNAFQPILFQTLHWNDGQQFDPAVRDVLLQAPESMMEARELL